MSYFIVIVQSLLIIGLGWMALREAHRSHAINKQLKACNDHLETVIDARDSWELQYFALEKGADEDRENYEQDFLGMKELIEKQRNTIVNLSYENDYLEAYLERHERECLPILGDLRWRALEGAVENA